MDWRDYRYNDSSMYDYDLDGSLDEAVDETMSYLVDHPYGVIVDLEEIGADYELIDSVAKACANKFGVYARSLSDAIPIIHYFPSLGLAQSAYTQLSAAEFAEDVDDTTDIVDDIFRDCEYQGYIEVHGIEYERKLIGHAYESSNGELIYVVNETDRVDIQ